MLYNFIDNSEKRTIFNCNFNQHIRSAHPDRIMAEHDLIYIREGNWQIAQDGINFDLKKGDVILLQGNHHHYGLIPCDDIVKTCFIHFNTHPTDRVSSGDKCANAWIFPMVVHCDDNKMVEHYFNRIIYSYWSDDEYNKKKASAYLDLLLCELSSTAVTSETSDSLVESILLKIKKTPDRFISIEEIAKEYKFSARTISARFKKHTGYSLHKWQMIFKCQMADELIGLEPSLTLKEIAATYGFYDEYHFSKCFKKILGRSPKKSTR